MKKKSHFVHKLLAGFKISLLYSDLAHNLLCLKKKKEYVLELNNLASLLVS